jgi:lipopolysaccharide/colanic/teichoic acid biosynthesis glycosyltransferase
MIFNSTYSTPQSMPNKYEIESSVRYFHSLTSKWTQNNELLLVTGYDYFFNKSDFKRLLKNYQYIVIMPQEAEPHQVLSDKVLDILYRSTSVTWVHQAIKAKDNEPLKEIVLKLSVPVHLISTEDFCENILKKIYIPADTETLNNARWRQRITGNMLLSNVKNPLNKVHQYAYFGLWVRVLKKSVDWIGGGLLLLLTLPVWAYAALIIRRQSPGSIFFRQQRVGIRQKEFDCVKFRSMSLDAEANGAQFASRNDSRVFKWGRTMRATRIDELPQLLNIIKGEMSLIGPRPERKVFIETFEELIPDYNQRHAVKPGLSGYAQVMYSYGCSVSDARHKLMYDLYYIKNWSVGLEIFIAIETVRTMIAKRGL